MITLKADSKRVLVDENGKYSLSLDTADRAAVNALRALDGALRVTVSKWTEKRSLDANAYFWVLADKLAVKLSERGAKPITKEEIYRQYIVDIGHFEQVCIKEEAVEAFTAAWTHGFLGRQAVDMGAVRAVAGYRWIYTYYSSSEYDKEQMRRLIDMVVADCKEQGIETRTPNELADLISLWGEK